MPLNLQARLLIFIQNNEIKPLGGAKTKKVDVRIISATNKNLKDAIAKQHFREDLFYRLNVLPIHIPPLRERKEDIPLLLEHFMMKEARAMDIEPKKVSGEARRFLMDYSWKGNVRELENFVKHILVIVNGNQITMDDLSLHFMELSDMDKVGFPMAPATGQMAVRSEAVLDYGSLFGNRTWEEVERTYILYLLEKNRWNITRAAKATGVNRSTFDSRMKKLGIRKS
jgi:DNA-binding NtrC family response regulator